MSIDVPPKTHALQVSGIPPHDAHGLPEADGTGEPGGGQETRSGAFSIDGWSKKGKTLHSPPRERKGEALKRLGFVAAGPAAHVGRSKRVKQLTRSREMMEIL